jgi:hypothetical protein
MDIKSITCNGRAALYAALWEDIRYAAMDCGWAVALHGSLARDMDIIAMKWVEDCTDAQTMIDTIISRCFEDNFLAKTFTKCSKDVKPHGRICYSIPIWGNHYLDISLIE